MAAPLAISNLQRKVLPGPQYLDALVASRSHAGPAVVHLDADGTTFDLSYTSLHHASWNLASRIRKHRIGFARINTIIPVILPQGPLLYLSYLGILRAGAAFCPVLPDTPDERLQFIVDDVQADLVLCMPQNVEHLQAILPKIKCIPLNLNDELDQLEQHSKVNISHEQVRRPSDVAYVMYTSGSTGKPKGVLISHYAVTQSLIAHDEHLPTFRIFFQFAAPTFDVSVFEIFFPWFRGATLASSDREATLADLPAVLRQLRVDALELTPTVATTLLRKRDAVPGLKALLTIGEMLTPQIIEEFGESTHQSGILFAMYGPTEAAIHCTIVPAMRISSSVRDIGKPLSTVTAFILGESVGPQEPIILQPGEIGELAIAGQLAHGYLNRPAESRSAFVDLPGHGIVYRTGDRAAMSTDGTLQIHGRISGGQVKLRGQRVELGEIESVALQAEGVDLAVASVIQDTLILFCSGRPSVSSAQIEARCRSWLPRHMRPSGVIVLEHNMPRLPSGKIDRKGLEQIYQDSHGTTSCEESENGDQDSSWIRTIIAEEIGIKIDDHQSLWSCGLNSLRAIKIASRLRERYHDISVSIVLEAETITHLTMMLESQNIDVDRSETASQVESEDGRWTDIMGSIQKKWNLIEVAGVVKIIPCSKMQNAMLAETSHDHDLYFNSITLRTRSPVSYSQILEALKEVAKRNPILRSAFESTGNSYVPFVQIVNPEPSFERTTSMQNPLSVRPGKDDREFIVTIHHALYDGWSWDLLMKDINTFLDGESVPPRPSFEHFSRLMKQKSELRIEEDLTEWAGLLCNVEFHRFPTLRSTHRSRSSRSCYSASLSTSARRLSEYALAMRVNVATAIHAALSLLLEKYLDTHEIVTGVVLAGREPVMPEVEEVIGPCILTLPLLARLSDSRTIRDLLLLVYRQYTYCLRHSSASLAEIANALSLPMDNRMFDVLFVWQESLYSGDESRDRVFTAATHDHLAYTIVMEAEIKGDSLYIKSTYDTEKLSPDQIECVHAQMDAIVGQLVDNPDMLVDRVWENMPQPLLSVSQPWAESRPDDLTLLLHKSALQFPGRVAVDFVTDFNPNTRKVSRETLTYEQLYRRASRIASSLVETHALTNDDIVAICCTKSSDLYITICAVILAGAAYLCIDPNTPERRIHTILEQAIPKVVIVDGPDSRLTTGSCSWSVLKIEDVVRSKLSSERRLETQSSGSDLAYAVFTSGSTGIPKGVLITRDNLASNVQYLSTTYPFSSSSRLLQSCSQAFDVSVFEIFWTWACGLTLCSATNDTIFKDIEVFIDTMNITHLSMTPSVAALVHPSNVPKVNFIVCAGEPMSAKVYNLWVSRGLHQGYGPSETTNICNVRSYPEGAILINNVGPAFANTSLFVCARQESDRRNQELSIADFKPLPRGAIGEIWIGGQQVGRGYTDPELTRRAFFDHPHYGRLFKSGDFGRLLPDNSLIVTGREDDQTKIRGQRIELNEINSSLMQSVHVSDAFAMILSADSDREKLVAFWVYKNEKNGDPRSLVNLLYDHLHETMPSYMIPENLIPLPRLPLTPQGKVDKRGLLAVYHTMGQTELAGCSPNHNMPSSEHTPSQTEHKIASILADMTHVPFTDINVHASFFGYGIDSMRAIVLARRIKEAGFTAVEVSDILKHASVIRLASRLEKSNLTEPTTKHDIAAEAVPFQTRENVRSQLESRGLDVASILPCTPLQVTMALAHETSSDQAYSNHIVYHLRLDAARIKQAWAAMVDRHHLLRTMFALTDNEDYPCVQVVLKGFGLPWQMSDNEEPQFTGSPFKGPPYRLYLKHRSSRVELHLFIHHALYDAEALVHLQTDIQSYCLDSSLTVRPPFLAYLNFMRSVNQQKLNQFWNHTLKDLMPCRLSKSESCNRSRPESTTRTVRHSMPWTKLTSHAKSISVTPLALMQAALARMLSGYTNSTDVCFGTVFSGRNIDVADVDKIIGPCFNTLPTRVHLRPSHTSADLCQDLQRFNISVLPYQATSLRGLQKQYGPLGTPLFDVLLLLQSAAPDLDPRVWKIAHEEGQMPFPVIFEVQHDSEPGALDIHLHNSTLADSGFLDDVLTDFADMITDTIEHLDLLALDRIPSSNPTSSTDPGVYHKTNGQALSNGSARKMKETPVSRQVFRILHESSKREISEITPSTTIFHLGLDSITAVQLAVRLRKSDFQISAGDILEKPKVCDIVQLCEHRQSTHLPRKEGYNLIAFDNKHRKAVAKRLNIEQEELSAVWPCTATQIGIISEYLKSDGTCYYNSVRLRLTPQTDTAYLRKALEDITKTHAILRTGFVELDHSESPYGMVVYSRNHPDLRYLENAITDTSRTSTSLLDGLSRPPWHVELRQAEKATYVELHMLHALYDAFSLRVILRDLAALYYGNTVSNRSSLDEALSAMVASNQAKCDVDKVLPFSVSELQATRFPNLNILREVAPNFETATLTLKSDAETVRSQCAALDCSLSTVLQATWAQLLAAYTGQGLVTFGNIYSGRSFENEAMNEVAFPCINTLPVFVDVKNEKVSVLEQVAKLNAHWQRNPHLSLSGINRSLGIEGVLFDTIIALQQDSLTESDAPWEVESETATAEYATSLEIFTVENRIRLLLTYNQAVLPPEHSLILLKQYETILCDMLGLADGAAAAAASLVSMRSPACEIIPSDELCLHDLVLTSAARCLQKIAIEFVTDVGNDVVNRESWTYEQTIMAASRVANLLVENGSRAGDMIALCCEKSPYASFALLAILMAGCAYVAIDPSAPASRKDFILDDSQCKIVLVDSFTAGNFAAREVVTCLRIDDGQLLNQQSSHFDSSNHRVSPNDVCYCLYTSGTTGTPKGCLITHQSAVQAMMSFSRIFEGHWTKDSRWLQFAAYHFDVSVLEHFWSWKEGICVTVVPRDVLFEDLPGTINRVGITHLDMTPSLARLLTPESVPFLCQGVFIVGGEQVRQDIIETWGDANCLYNFYGPSEVTIGCTVHPRVRRGVKPANIGCQWDNVGTLVLEPDMQKPVLVGAVGELCLSGILVGKGYLNRPELTAEKFIIFEATGERIYRSGDLVRMLHDHSFEFLGRIDDQVKLRGQRLEIGEINHAILQCSSEFQDVATMVLEHPEQEKQHLVAFLARKKDEKKKEAGPVILQGNDDLQSTAQIRSQALQLLPGYMVPTYFLVLNFLPLTVNNKVDFKALRSVYTQISISDVRKQQQSPSALTNQNPEIHSRFIGTIADYLELSKDNLSMHDSLLQLGVDSISAIGLARALRRNGFANASVTAVLKRSVVADLAAFLCASSNCEVDPSKADQEQCMSRIEKFANRHRTAIEQILGTKVEAIAPCTALQEGMISKLVADDSDQPPYMTKFVFELDPSIDLARLQQAWRELRYRLDILRLRFVPTDDGFAQVVLPSTKELVTEICPHVGPTRDELPTQTSQLFNTWVQSARHLDSATPWEVHIMQRDSGKSAYMSIFIFHGLYDGISMESMLTYLHQLYENPRTTHSAPQFLEALSYGPLLRKDDAAQFWRRNLPSICLLDLPAPAIPSHEDNTAISVHQKLLAPGVRETCSNLAVTPQAVFHAAWLYTLAEHFKRNLTIGIVVSGRSIELEHAENIIGPMFNTLPFTINSLLHSAHLADLIQACHKKNVDVLPYQHTSLSSIRKHLHLPSNRELFDSLFVYQGTAQSSESSKQPWTEVQSESRVEYPLNVEIQELEANRYEITIAASEKCLGIDEVTNLLDSFISQLENVSLASNILLSTCFFEEGEEFFNNAQQSATTSDGVTLPDEWTEDAETIRAVLSELADADSTGIGLNSPTIFELGLDSVDALKLVARLKGRGIQVSVSKILQNPTVAGILAQHAMAQASAQPGDTVDLQFINMQGRWRSLLERQGFSTNHVDLIMPTTPLQQGLLVEFEKYFHTMVFKIRENVAVPRLASAVRECMRAMTILRTTFATIERAVENKSALMQIVKGTAAKADRVQVDYLKNTGDLKSFVDGFQNNNRIADSAPELRLIDLENGEKYLVLAFSHASYDAWSLGLMLRHLENVYMKNESLTDDTQLVARYVYNIHKEHESPEADEFWSSQLTHARRTLVKVDKPNAQRSASLRKRVSQISLEQVRTACRRHGITLQSLGLATWALQLITLTRQTDASFGVVVSGRIDELTEKLVFPTFNTVVFRARMNTDMSKHQLLLNVHDQAVKIFEYQQFPLSKALSKARTGDGELFNTLFTFQRTPNVETTEISLFEEIDLGERHISPPYAINVELQEMELGLEWTIATQKGVMSIEEIESSFDSLDQILEFLANPEDKDVFQVRGGGTSICGLPPITVEEDSDDTHLEGIDTRLKDTESAKTDWSSRESQMRDVFSEVAGVDVVEISKETSLYHLGLDSVSAIKVSRLLKELGTKIPVSAILKHQTIAKIALAASEIGASTVPLPEDQKGMSRYGKDVKNLVAAQLRAAEIAENEVEDVLLATGGQVYMLDMWRASKGRLFYATFSFEVKHCDRRKFDAAFAQLVKEIPALRTRFIVDGSKTYQVVFNSSSNIHGPVQYELAEQGSGLIVALHIHHALYDAISLGVMVRRLKGLCSADMYKAEARETLFTDQRSFLNSLQLDEPEGRQFWTDYLAYTDHKAKSASSFELPRTELFIPGLLRAASLESVARRAGMSVQAIFFATVARVHARQKAISALTSPETVVIGVYLANRSLDIEGLSDLAVPTFNIVPLKVNISPSVSILDAAKQVQVDLQEITKAERCGISLRDIHAWTDLNIDCYVNFLRLPDAEVGTVRTKEQGNEEVEIEHAEGELRERAKALIQADEVVSPFVEGSVVNEGDTEWCSAALDVEAKTDGQGNLAVGMFAPGDMLDEDGVKALMEELRVTLWGVSRAE